MSVVGCLLISFAALTTEDLSTANQQSWNKKLSVQGQICHATNETGELWKDKPVNYLGIFLIFMGLFLAGFGRTVYFSLSVSYLDDNVSRRVSPLGNS